MNAPKTNVLVAVEGPDGCGKTQQSQRLAEYLKAEWRRFPNRDTPMGKLIDAHLKRQWTAIHVNGGSEVLGNDSLLTDALVFQGIQLANRIECAQDFKETLTKTSIICDRYWPSGYAFGGADGLDKPYMIKLHEGLLQPDLFILFDIDAEVAFERVGKRGGQDRYETDLAFARKVVANYRELWDSHRDDTRWKRIDAGGSVEDTWKQLLHAVRPLFPT